MAKKRKVARRSKKVTSSADAGNESEEAMEDALEDADGHYGEAESELLNNPLLLRVIAAVTHQEQKREKAAQQ